MGKISIKDIKAYKYEGYLWWSDKENPDVIEGKVSDLLPSEGANPFVAEGLLYNKEKGLSYSIKYVDGCYIVQEYTVTDADKANPDNQEKTYLSNRMGNKRLKFLRYWEEMPDKANHKLPVLTQTKNVFIGFENKEESV